MVYEEFDGLAVFVPNVQLLKQIQKWKMKFPSDISPQLW